MNKYEPLEKFLTRKGMSQIPMTFSDIESVIHDSLPPSARKHRAWWSNNPSNSVITYAWLAAGYKTSQVNLEAEQLVFIKDEPESLTNQAEQRHPAFGCMKGIGVLADGVDLTEPADAEWGAALEAASLYNE